MAFFNVEYLILYVKTIFVATIVAHFHVFVNPWVQTYFVRISPITIAIAYIKQHIALPILPILPRGWPILTGNLCTSAASAE